MLLVGECSAFLASGSDPTDDSVFKTYTHRQTPHIFEGDNLTLGKKKFSPISISRKLLKVPGHTAWRLERLWPSVKA